MPPALQHMVCQGRVRVKQNLSIWQNFQVLRRKIADLDSAPIGMHVRAGREIWVLTFDHLVVVARTLDEGTQYVADSLGFDPKGGGRHEVMGTWNRVVSLGPGEYLEVISVDPDAPAPARTRWFDLDRFNGTPRLGTWVCRVVDLPATLCVADPQVGRALPLERGDLRWSITATDDGRMPFDGAHPGIIEWQGPHPTDRLADDGLRLLDLEVSHPDPKLGDIVEITDSRVQISVAGDVRIRARISTPAGPRWLS